MPPRKSTAVLRPNLGLYLNRDPIDVPDRGLQAGSNFRIKDGKLTNLNVGYTELLDYTFNGAIIGIFTLLTEPGVEVTIIATPTDLYNYNAGTPLYITPIYATGTASASGTAVTGVGDAWSSNAKAGDQISFGANDENDPDATWYTIDTVNADHDITLTASAGTVGSGSYTIRQLYTGTTSDFWEADVFNYASPDNENLIFMTNGVDYPAQWNGSDAQVTPLDSIAVSSAKHVITYKNMMIYANVIQSGDTLSTTIVNSDVGVPADTSNGLASQLVVHGGTDGIKQMAIIGDNLVFYSGNHIVLGQFVGDPLVFVFRTISDSIGTLYPRTAIDYGDYHKLLGTDTIYRFDGASLTREGDHVWPAVLSFRDPERTDYGVSYIDRGKNEAVWAIPLTSDPGAGEGSDVGLADAYVEHYAEDVGLRTPAPFSHRAFPFISVGQLRTSVNITWDDLVGDWDAQTIQWADAAFFTSFSQPIGGTFAGKLYKLSSGDSADGTALASSVHFGRRALGDGRLRGLLARVYAYASPAGTSASNLSVTTHLQDTALGSDTDTEVNTFDLSLPEGSHFVTPYRRARFFSEEAGTSGPGEVWELAGYDVEIRPGGRR